MIEYDKGPTKSTAKLFAKHPDYSPIKDHFWFDWGPVFYRGRLDGSARILCVASDPGPTERVACRALVGDAGQRVQGFLLKLGLTRSYVCLNAFVYALHPSHFYAGRKLLEDPEHIQWRNKVFEQVTSPKLEAVVAFGSLAQIAVGLWNGTNDRPIFNIHHPSHQEDAQLLAEWRGAIEVLRNIVAPDTDGNIDTPNYGDKFTEQDYAAIPRRDLPFGVPSWLGDDRWGRLGTPGHRNCVSRPNPDDGHTLIWIAPPK